ncbi:MAG TPA: NAD(P)/FAD-dependent oxidoreductase [Nocardioidaceae bacterium]|nr:NAD(P)/FAD-dependent oxidoreductase [Nocardioidaceae bacterium]
MVDVTDAVVIGSGPNGLVAANLLADAGWSVTVLEAQPTLGGAVRTDTEVYPGFRHDTFSAFYPLAAASHTIRSLHLEDHGLTWLHAPAVLGHPLTDGTWAMLYRDRDSTAASLDRLHPGDGQAWLDLCARWDIFGDDLIEALLQPFPPVRAGSRFLLNLPRAGGLSAFGLPLVSVRRLGERLFGGEGARLLLAGNALHADFAPSNAGSGIFGLILVMLGQTVGFPVPQGGAGELIAALARRLESAGGTIVTNAEAASVIIADGRAVGVRLADGEQVSATRAVVANVSAPALYGGLVSLDDLPARTRWGMKRFRWDPSTIKVDWALSSPVPWDPAPPDAPGTVHIAHSVDELAGFAAQIKGSTVPAAPLLLVGQMTATDPTRSPAGTESLWAYTHVPQQTRSDAGGAGIRGVWDSSDLERMADRMQARIARFAPGLADRILSRRAMGPREFEAADANLHGGAINGGTAALRQELVLRPVPGMGRPETPIKGLFLGSASAHPGGGVHGAPGANAAKAALAQDRSRQSRRQ